MDYIKNKLTKDVELSYNKLLDCKPLIVIDHSRAGNAFFTRLFDQHNNVLVMPHIGYLPFHLEVLFNGDDKIEWGKAFNYILTKTDVKFVFNDLDDEIINECHRQGDNPNYKIDRPLARTILSQLMEKIGMISKKEIIVCIHSAYSIAVGKDIDKIKYILMNDQPLHYKRYFNDSVSIHYSNNKTYKDSIFIHLIRDPRANFASLRHQFIKIKNGMYDYSTKGLIKSLIGIFGGPIIWKKWCTYLYIYNYTCQGYRALTNWRLNSVKNFYVLKNEDINLNFIPTMENLSDLLNLEMHPDWLLDDYVPTSGGEIWKGSGAYNKNYLKRIINKQVATNQYRHEEIKYRFPINNKLVNDTKEVSETVTGPNEYVTKRWRSRLLKSEIKILEVLYEKEMKQHNYDFIYLRNGLYSKIRLLLYLIYPFNGECISFKWMKSLIAHGYKGIMQLILELLLFPIFYLLGRMTLIKLLIIK